MRTKRRLLLAFLLVVVLGLLAWVGMGPHEPVFEGRSLTQWVDDASAQSLTNRGIPVLLMDGSDRKVRHFGPTAVPPLVALLESTNSWKKKLREFLITHKVQNKWAIEFIKGGALESLRPQTAASFLGYMGPDAEAAVPALMHAAVSQNLKLSQNALNALGTIHQQPDLAIPFLIKLSGDPNQQVNLSALGALGQFTQRPDLVVPVLVQAMSNKSEVVIPASRLLIFGTNALAAVPALRRAAAEGPVYSQYYAAAALWRIAPDSNDDVTVPAFIRMLQDRTGPNPWPAIQTLFELGPRARAAVPALLEVIALGFPQNYGAPYALRTIDPEAAAKIWPEELKRWQDMAAKNAGASAETREQFAARIISNKEPIIPRLITMLLNRDKAYPASLERDHAAYMLGEMGASARAAIPALIDARLGSPSARAALMKIRGQSPLPLFTQLKETSNWQDWRETAMMTGDFGPNAEPAIPMILSALKLPNASPFRYPAASALGDIHRHPDVCVPALIHLLGDPDSGTRSKAIEALAKFGPDARPALPQIIQALEDLDYNVRVHATNIVQNLDPEAAAKAGIK